MVCSHLLLATSFVGFCWRSAKTGSKSNLMVSTNLLVYKSVGLYCQLHSACALRPVHVPDDYMCVYIYIHMY